MYCSPVLAGVGFGGGLLLGSINNIIKTKSLFEKKDTSQNPGYLYRCFLKLQEGRELEHDTRRANGNQLKMGLWNPLFPPVQMAALALTGVWHIVSLSQRSEATFWLLALKTTQYVLKAFLRPLAYARIATNVSVVMREIIKLCKPPLSRFDPSGHAVLQGTSAIYKIYCLVALSEMGIDSPLYKGIVAICCLSDFAWTYQTVVHHHSVAEMVTMVAAMAIGVALLHFSGVLTYRVASFIASQGMSYL